jgi:hypothetical protein
MPDTESVRVAPGYLGDGVSPSHNDKNLHHTTGPAPAADGTGWPTSGSGLVLTDSERDAIRFFATYGGPAHRANTLRELLERLT